LAGGKGGAGRWPEVIEKMMHPASRQTKGVKELFHPPEYMKKLKREKIPLMAVETSCTYLKACFYEVDVCISKYAKRDVWSPKITILSFITLNISYAMHSTRLR